MLEADGPLILSRRHVLMLVGGGLAAWRPLHATTSGFWDKKPPADWSSEEIDKLITKSPWAKEASAQGAAPEGGTDRRPVHPTAAGIREGRPGGGMGDAADRNPGHRRHRHGRGRPAHGRQSGRRTRPAARDVIQGHGSVGKRPAGSGCAQDAIAGRVCEPLRDCRDRVSAAEQPAPLPGRGGDYPPGQSQETILRGARRMTRSTT